MATIVCQVITFIIRAFLKSFFFFFSEKKNVKKEGK